MSKKNRQAKEMELETIEEVAAPAEEAKVEEKVEVPKIEFDGWWALRSPKIPAIHKKEIVKADFKGRKVPMVATIKEFDAALLKYGVKLA